MNLDEARELITPLFREYFDSETSASIAAAKLIGIGCVPTRTLVFFNGEDTIEIAKLIPVGRHEEDLWEWQAVEIQQKAESLNSDLDEIPF